jgi:hypothetical protein
MVMHKYSSISFSSLQKDESPPTPCEIPKHMQQISIAVVSAHVREILDKIEDPTIKSQLQAVI